MNEAPCVVFLHHSLGWPYVLVGPAAPCAAVSSPWQQHLSTPPWCAGGGRGSRRPLPSGASTTGSRRRPSSCCCASSGVPGGPAEDPLTAPTCPHHLPPSMPQHADTYALSVSHTASGPCACLCVCRETRLACAAPQLEACTYSLTPPEQGCA